MLLQSEGFIAQSDPVHHDFVVALSVHATEHHEDTHGHSGGRIPPIARRGPIRVRIAIHCRRGARRANRVRVRHSWSRILRVSNQSIGRIAQAFDESDLFGWPKLSFSGSVGQEDLQGLPGSISDLLYLP